MKRKNWNDELIIDSIHEVIDHYELDRMPSRKEIELYFGNSSLTNAMSKRGGYEKYANLLGLDMKSSETVFGKTFEVIVSGMLKEKGFSVEMTGARFPYDLLVNGSVKIDVKASKHCNYGSGDFYSFNLESKLPRCDAFIAIGIDDKKHIEKVLIIPSVVMAGKSQLSVGICNSKYDKYKDRWDIIANLSEAFMSVC